jgi:hypothetical protein
MAGTGTGWVVGEMGRWEDGKMGRWEDGKMGRWEIHKYCVRYVGTELRLFPFLLFPYRTDTKILLEFSSNCFLLPFLLQNRENPWKIKGIAVIAL